MAVRVALLILVTGTFTALWSGDHPEQMAAVDRPVKVLVGRRKSPQEKRHFESPTTSVGSGRITVSTASPLDQEFAQAPLPEGISAGTYLVADRFARTGIRVVTEWEANSHGRHVNRVAAEHYSVIVGKACWHYIRVGEINSDRIAVSSDKRSSAR